MIEKTYVTLATTTYASVCSKNRLFGWMETLLILLLVLSCGHEAAARSLPAGPGPHSRRLQGWPSCPAGCDADGGCVPDGSGGAGYLCQRCAGSLLATPEGQCGCPRGTYYSAENTCTSCPRGSFCTGGPITAGGQQPQAVACPDSMTTLGMRSSSIIACVNMPGYVYVSASGSTPPTATACPVDTWSPGLRKQRGCLPCTPGYTTGGVAGASTASACYVPAGYEITDSTGVARPCPRGTYKSTIGTGGNNTCAPCAGGVTTPADGSTSAANCSVLLPGVYAAAMDGTTIMAARRCPQRMYCPGGTPLAAFVAAEGAAPPAGDASIVLCPSGQWTEGLGAATVEQCMTPPGFMTAGGNTTRCPEATFRDGWAADEAAASTCVSCGQGVFGSHNEQIDVFDPATEAITLLPVATDSSGCYIKPGMGLYRQSLDGIHSTWYARNCDQNSYGVHMIAYGRVLSPCRNCPAGMVTSKDAASYPHSASFYSDNGDGSGGFINPRACVTQPGYGYNGRTSTPCPQGLYNDKDTLGTCTRCPLGTSTAGVGAGVTLADCKLAPGYGAAAGGGIASCPLGTFNDAVRNDTTTPCTACPAGTTTLEGGASSAADCGACLPGFGGAGCAQQCGGRGAAASYGPPGRSLDSGCSPCSQSVVGYVFATPSGLDTFAPAAIARPGADAAMDCLSEFCQTQDSAWHLPFAGGLTTTPGVATFAACVALCGADCQFVTYEYTTQQCGVKMASVAPPAGSPVIAYKTEQSGDMAASSRKRRARMQRLRRAGPTAGTAALRTSATTKAPTALLSGAMAARAGAGSSSNGNATAKTLSSGSYVWWLEPAAASIGIQAPAPGASSFTSVADCLLACDLDNACTAFVVDGSLPLAQRPASCRLVRGDPQLGTLKRSMTRADVTRLVAPQSLFEA